MQPNAHDGMTIGQLAKRAEVSVETVRFYERRALLVRPPRPRSGYRRYGEAALRRLSFIRRAKRLGFTLSEIRELLELSTGTSAACAEVEETAERTIARIDAQITELLRMKAALGDLARSCLSGEGTAECPILEALEGIPESESSPPKQKKA